MMRDAIHTLREFAHDCRTNLRGVDTEQYCSAICKEIGLFMKPDGIDPHKLVEEYERLKKIMPYYPSEGELMRLALQSMEHVVQ